MLLMSLKLENLKIEIGWGHHPEGLCKVTVVNVYLATPYPASEPRTYER